MSEYQVSWRASPPAAGITNTWRVPVCSDANAIQFPSGENLG
jgi:hypothetical protein